MKKLHALVPLKSRALAKSRLAGLLDAGQRGQLAEAMAADVLAVLASHRHVASVTLIGDGDGAAALADACGAAFLPEHTLGVTGLNAVLAAAADAAVAQGAGRLLLLHGDLPLLRESDITAVVGALEQGADTVLGCDLATTGTNLLACEAAARPALCFGAGSAAGFRAAAKEAGHRLVELQRPGIGLDIDEPEDLEQLLAYEHVGPRTARLLADSGLAARLASPSLDWPALAARLLDGDSPSDKEALALAQVTDTAALAEVAGQLRDRGHGSVVTYSRKVFIPLTKLCRDVCHYCTFAQTPGRIKQAFLSVDEVLELCREAAAVGCQEALFTLGEKPELRYSAAREALSAMGFASTLEYLQHVAGRVLEETGLLPHINAGCMTREEIAGLRQVSASMGIMLESASERLCEQGMPHYGSPDKLPARRLATLELAGEAGVPFTSGILIGIGETRRERIEALLALRASHQRHGHLQEVIVQNFRAKPGTLMASSPEPDLDELLWTLAVARLVFGAGMSIQAPPNLSPGVLPQLVAAGINDWGGVSPLTPDHVNPEAPWPHLAQLARETALAGKFLDQRLTIYPRYIAAAQRWLDPAVTPAVLAHCDSAGFARRDSWVPGEQLGLPAVEQELLAAAPFRVEPALQAIVERCLAGQAPTEVEVTRLFESRGPEFAYVVQQADRLRRERAGDTVSYVVNRNINYTNVCYFKCQFCAFSKGKHNEALRGRPYDLSGEEIARRCSEAWQRGASEVCMQGGIHPDYTGQTYLDILHTVRAATPDMHIHAFSPLEVWQGAETLGQSLPDYLRQLREAGLRTLPGTAAEILDDEVRAILCPDKINTGQWLEVMAQAHAQGLRSTATIMFGHVDSPRHWARHLLRIRELQARSGGFTEFVPLPFVHMEAPMFLRGRARRGPTFREALLMHAVPRLVFNGLIDNIQASWVKMGREGVAACLQAGANDLGGTLMNESITRAAGSGHGQEWPPGEIELFIEALDRRPRLRDTLYRDVPESRRQAALAAATLLAIDNQPAGRLHRDKRLAEAAPEFGQVVLLAACD